MAEQDRDQARLRRKLTQEHRYKMALLARDRFRDPALREIEAAARQTFADLLYRDAQSVPKKEIAVLEKHRYAQTMRGVDLPPSVTVREGDDRSFERPDGVKVERKGGKTRTVKRPLADDYELPRFPTWQRALRVTADRVRDDSWGDGTRQITFPKPVTVPGTSMDGDGHAYIRTTEKKEGEPSKFTLDGLRSAFVTQETIDALGAYYVAGDARICAERRLIVAAIKVIASCDVYAQVLDFWPEVAEIEESLFGPDIIPNAFSVVVLSDEDKAALCSNMGQRGVQSAICSRRAA